MPIRVLRNVHLALIALAVSALTANAQVGEADHCLKVHSTPCKKYAGGIHSMGFVIQNTCDRDVLAFVRKQHFTAAHPAEKGFWRSNLTVRMAPRGLRNPKYQGSGSTACAKKPSWAFCAEYKPDNFKELTDDYTNHVPFLKMLAEKSACYREITKEPFSNQGIRYRPIENFSGKIADRRDDRGDWHYDAKFLRFG